MKFRKMGFQTEFNWILKLKSENGFDEEQIKEGKEYSFSKDGYRIYPLHQPIDLINNNWEAVAKALVLEFVNKDGKTSGKYKVVKVYSQKEKEFLTNYWRENLEITKGKKFTDFHGIKMT